MERQERRKGSRHGWRKKQGKRREVKQILNLYQNSPTTSHLPETNSLRDSIGLEGPRQHVPIDSPILPLKTLSTSWGHFCHILQVISLLTATSFVSHFQGSHAAHLGLPMSVPLQNSTFCSNFTFNPTFSTALVSFIYLVLTI